MLPDRCIRVTIRLQGKRVPFRRRFRPFPSPVTSAHPSPATFRAVSVAHHLRHTSPATFLAAIVAHHLRSALSSNVSGHFRHPSPPPYLSGDVSGFFRCPSPPAARYRGLNPSFPRRQNCTKCRPCCFPPANLSAVRPAGPNTLPIVDMLCVMGADKAEYNYITFPALRDGSVSGRNRCRHAC